MRATVLMPTRGASSTLERCLGRILGQTARDLELFVVGDGVGDEARAVLCEMASKDSRVRFFDNPKGPRRGELHRHAALQEARGEIVCYTTDDDLWLADHVETMEGLLGRADFAQAPTIAIAPEGGIQYVDAVDHALPAYRELHRAGLGAGALSCGAHTLDMYRRLPFGWRTTPEGTPTDHYMWLQFLTHPGCRAVRGTRPTVLSFPSPWRKGWPPERLVAEWDRWAARVDAPGGREEIRAEVLDWVMRDRALLAVWPHRWRVSKARTIIWALRAAFRRVARGVPGPRAR